MKRFTPFHLWQLLAIIFFVLIPAAGRGETRIGVIMSGDIPYYGEMHEAFLKELHQKLPPGKTVEVILQRPFPDPIAWSNAARKLIAVEVDLIVTYGAAAAQAVVQEKSAIPLVYAGVYDPEQAGVKGGMVTGCGFRVPLSSLLRYFKRVQALEGLTVVFSSNEDDSLRQKDELLALAAQQNVKVRQMDIKKNADLEQLRALDGKDPVFITGSALTHVWLNEILTILRLKKVVVGSIFPDAGGLGVLIALFQPPADQGRTAATMAARILQGEKPSGIPPEVLRETELVFNLVEAQHIGITFPIQLIVEATRVIK